MEDSGTGVDVWIAYLKPPYPTEVVLTPEERQRSEGFLRRELAERWVASRWALRQVLSTYLGEPPEAIAIETGESGKPRLAGGNVEFNLSHSGEIGLVAVSRERPVGVDVERIEPARDLLALAERALKKDDISAVRDAPPAERPEIFYDRWVRHEARLKCLGVGLAGPDPGLPVDVRTLDVAPGYAAAVALG